MYAFKISLYLATLHVTCVLQVSDLPKLCGVKEDYERTMTCVFWDPSLDSGFGNWSSEGCRLVRNEDDKAFCECDHLTTFAILVVCVHNL